MSLFTSGYTGAAIDEILASVDYTKLTEKTTPHDNDLLIVQDSQDEGATKKVKVGNLPGGSGGTGDMLKAVYDTDNDGSVDKADAIDGVASAGSSKYYGTNGSGTAGFHDIPSGGGTGDMLKATYDPTAKNQDAFAYADSAASISGLTAETAIADTDFFVFNDVSVAGGVTKRKTLWSNIKSVLKAYFDTLYAAASHSHSYMPLSGGTFTGQAVAQANTSYTTAQMRNVILSTSDPTGGNNGDIWIKYET